MKVVVSDSRFVDLTGWMSSLTAQSDALASETTRRIELTFPLLTCAVQLPLFLETVAFEISAPGTVGKPHVLGTQIVNLL